MNRIDLPGKGNLIPRLNQWSHRVIPQIYDDALSYDQRISAFMKHLNMIGENQNLTNENFIELYEFFISLEKHVDNYFTNLDVQDEINGKLDDLVSDGTMDTIINHNIFNDLNQQLAQIENELESVFLNPLFPPDGVIAATGDNVADDTIALQSLFDYAATHRKKIIVPSGYTFLVSETINVQSNTYIDFNNSVIKLKNETVFIDCILKVKNAKNVSFENVLFDGNSSNQPFTDDHWVIGLVIQNAENITIKNCHFFNWQRQAIQVVADIPQVPTSKGVHHLTVTHSTFNDVWSALQVTQSQSLYIEFSHNYVNNCYEHGVTTYPGNMHVIIKNNFIFNCGLNEAGTMYSAGSCIRLFETKYGFISNNIVRNFRFGGIRVALSEPTMTFQRSSDIVISDNIVLGGVRQGGNGHGIDVVGDSVTVSNNIVSNITNYQFGRGISIRGDDNIISNNKISDVITSAILANGKLNSITSNIIKSVSGPAITVGSNTPTDSIIANNLIKDGERVASSGIRMEAQAENTVLSGNNLLITAITKIKNLGTNTTITQTQAMENN